MTITVDTVGRNLHINVAGIDDPFVIRPLPSRAGIQITETFLISSAGGMNLQEVTEAFVMAVDGGRLNQTTGRWEPVPPDEQTTYTRIGDELSQSEAESILMPAFFWQTTLGMDGVRAYIDGGCGLAGTLKATAALTARLRMFTTKGGGDHV